MIKDYFIVSFNNLRSRRLRSWLTMLGIFIGIAAVVSLIGLGQGLRVAIMSQFGFLGTDTLSVQASGGFAGPPGSSVVDPLSDDLADKISRINGVEVAFNRYITSGTLEFNDRQGIGLAGSYPDGDNRKVFEKILNLKSEQGRLLKDGDGKKAVLGNSFTEEGNFGRGIKTGDRILLNDVEFNVVGILEKKGSFLLDSFVLVNEDVMIDNLDVDREEVNVIAIKVKDPKLIPQIKENIEKLLRKERGVDKGEENFVVQSPQAILEQLDSTLFAVQLFIYIIAGVSLAVGGIGIMNTMFTSVLERRKEIGIMKSIGARNSAIFQLFFMESGLLGAVGGVIGIILGMTMAHGAAFLGQIALGSDLIRAEISIFLILGALMFSFILGTFFGVLPAYQASKLQPVESLRSVT
ncbi:MAG: ABC transporter permease [Candidatus Woesearchaeota archaeon]|nr:ABC transporter permease [Candidatus Woesearchaeota archaeon]